LKLGEVINSTSRKGALTY